MNKDYVPSSPSLHRLVARSSVAAVVVLLALATLLPAPLGRVADPAHPPNPARSAWFLLWIQELVSHDTRWIWAVLVLATGFVALPWLRRSHAEHARWFPAGERRVAALAVVLACAILALTLVALYLRGEQWRLVWPS